MTGDEQVRLNKFIADCGVCSRRQADALIEEGRVSVNGEAAVMGQKVTSEDRICVDGKDIQDDGKTIIMIFNKPAGLVCTTAEDEKNNVVKYINYSRRIYPVGRLDKDSQGLLILTNRGDLVNGIMRSRYNHEKEYIVTTYQALNDKFLEAMASGVPILDTVTKPCKIERLGKYRFKIIITQGLNRQIRRMCEHFGYEVRELKRVRILNIRLDDLPEGQWRMATKAEKKVVMRHAGLE